MPTLRESTLLASWVGVLGLLVAQQAGESFGVPVFPGAEARPEVAEAVAAYYRPGLQETEGLRVAVFETPAEFQRVYDFYGPRMEGGKWGWRRKTRVMLQHTRTLEFMRAELLRERGQQERLPPVFRPLFGDPDWSQAQFSAKLNELRQRHPETRFEIVEGVRPIRGDRANSRVRVMVERPYLDLERMQLVDRTRIQLIKVWPGARESQ